MVNEINQYVYSSLFTNISIYSAFYLSDASSNYNKEISFVSYYIKPHNDSSFYENENMSKYGAHKLSSIMVNQ